jgi:trehalose 6-phosphate phosphatase
VTIWTTPPPGPQWALFLDVDGTLLEFQADPRAVRADAALLDLLPRLADTLGGALALVSGRPLAVLDEMFHPLVLPVAGLHGVERRSAAGDVRRHEAAVPPAARSAFAALVESHPGLLLEDKGASVALHYRTAPSLESVVRATAEQVAGTLGPGWHLLAGAFVYELKPAGVTKGTAVEAFLREPPFSGRRPVYVGDDLTDLDGMAAAERLGGDGIAVGTRVAARWRLTDPAATRQWLAHVHDTLLRDAPTPTGSAADARRGARA